MTNKDTKIILLAIALAGIALSCMSMSGQKKTTPASDSRYPQGHGANANDKAGTEPMSNLQTSPSQDGIVDEKADKVEVFLFHATHRCASCVAIGKLAGETVNEYFQPELQKGEIEFREINIDLPENEALAEKFQASGTALFINSIRENRDNISENTQAWFLWQDEARFKSYLRGELNNLLGKSI